MKVTHQAMRELLATVGPLTTREAAEFFPQSTHQNVAAVMSTMRKAARKQVYIVEWTREKVDAREYLRAVYTLGDRRDSPKPPRFTNAERCARRRAKNAIPKVANSIWTWGATL